jgi:hypothetical protein
MCHLALIHGRRGVGGTFFDLNALQDVYHTEPNSVVEVGG